jgi:hypothetical protein
MYKLISRYVVHVLTTIVQFFKSLQLKSCTPVLPPLLLLQTSVSVAISVVSDWPTNPITGDCSVTVAVVAVAVVAAALFTVVDAEGLTGCTAGASIVAAVGAAVALCNAVMPL